MSMSSDRQTPYKAAVIGSTGGIGASVLRRLQDDPDCEIALGYSRSTTPAVDYDAPDTLESVAEDIRDKVGELNLLFIATGILTSPGNISPEKSFSELTPEALKAQFHVNAIGPALALKALMPLLPRNGYCRVGLLSARVGSIGDNSMGGWISYRASKAALNQIAHTAAIELHRRNSDSVCLALHPGTIPTPLSEPYARDRFTHSPDECAENLLRVLQEASPDQTGGFYDYDGKEIVW